MMISMSMLKTKTFWGAVATICTGIGILVAGDVPTGLQTIAGGVMAIFLRDAISKK